MDKLDKKQREAVVKMSTARLTAKLASAGWNEEELETFGQRRVDPTKIETVRSLQEP